MKFGLLTARGKITVKEDYSIQNIEVKYMVCLFWVCDNQTCYIELIAYLHFS